MEKRALLAIALSILVVTIWSALFVPRPAPRPSPAPAAPAQESPVEPPRTESKPAVEAGPARAATEAKEFIVETDAYSVRFGNRGGRVLSWRLLRYVDDLKVPIDLVPRGLEALEEFPLRIKVTDDTAATKGLDEAYYDASVRDADPNDQWAGEGFKGKVVTFTFSDGVGLEANKKIALPQEGYVGRIASSLVHAGRPAPFDLIWAVGLPEPNDDKTNRIWHVEGQGVAHVGGRTSRHPAPKVSATLTLAAGAGAPPLLWGGLESTYFASLLLPEPGSAAQMHLSPAGELPIGPAGAKRPVIAASFAADGATEFTTFVGPKNYNLLQGLDRELDHAIDFSNYSVIYVLSKYLFLALQWVNGFVGNYGVSIILLTTVIRAALFPLTYRSAITMRQSAKKMAKIQPRVKAIQDKYRKGKRTIESQRQMNDEVMAIYKKEGINPMGSLGGCLPLLLQMPIFIAFYNLLSVTIELRGAPFFLWVKDLSRMDPTWIWPILMGISWLVQQWMTSSTIPDPVQRRMMLVMPVIFTYMMISMPSGLVIYWFVSNVIGLAQQYIINRQADREPVAAG